MRSSGDQVVVHESFKASLEAANHVTQKDNADWKHYVAGTVAFLEKDLVALKTHFENLPDAIEGEENPNKNILYNFIC